MSIDPIVIFIYLRGSQTWPSLRRMFIFWLGICLSLIGYCTSLFPFLILGDTLFCSVSLEGRIFVWKVSEGPDEEEKPQITGKIVIAVQILGDEEYVHPRICWHRHKQVMQLL